MDVFVSGLKRALARGVIGVLAFVQVMVLFPVQTAQAADPVVIEQGDLVINEVRPNADTTVGVDEKELVEILNISSKAFTPSLLATLSLVDMSGDDFGDNWSSITSDDLMPGEYLVVEDQGVLNNTADKLTLKAGAVIVDEFPAYSSTTKSKSFARIPNGTGNFVAGRDATFGQSNRLKPVAPSSVTVVPGDAELEVTWAAVVDAESYDVSIALTSAPSMVIDSKFDETDLAHTFTGLTNDQSYTVSIVAKNEVGTSAAVSAVGMPVAASPSVADPLTLSVVYYDATSTKDNAKSEFGVTSIHAEVTVVSGLMPTGITPTITFTRPGTAPQEIDLSFVSGATWKTVTPYVITKANSPQDGLVTVSVSTGATANSIVANPSFTVDTKVLAPVVTLAAMCAPAEDTVTVNVENDVVVVYVYRNANVDTSLVATNPGAAGTLVSAMLPVISKTASIGSNTEKVYLVAVDGLKNVSSIVEVANDVTAPTPVLQVEAGDKKITATWGAVNEATSYVFKWRKSDGSPWQQKVVTATSQEISADNGMQYDIAVASVDAACNQSEFVVKYATPRAASQVTARGGTPDVIAAERAYFSQPLMIAETKDGPADKEVSPKSPFSAEEDRDQNGIKDSEEDKNGNGIKDGEEQPTEGDGDGATTRDRSRLIVTIAILLILAGTALAAYSWYQGDDTPVASAPKQSAEATETEAAQTSESKEAAAPAADKPTKTAKKGGKGKRKTRW